MPAPSKRHPSPAGKPPSQRQRRVAEELRHALAAVLQRGEVHEPLLQTVPVTVSEVRVSPDLRNATAYVMPLAGQQEAAVLEALNRAVPELRGHLARAVRLRFAPMLRFVLDTSFDEARRIDALLRQVGAGAGPGSGEGGPEEDGHG